MKVEDILNVLYKIPSRAELVSISNNLLIFKYYLIMKTYIYNVETDELIEEDIIGHAS